MIEKDSTNISKNRMEEALTEAWLSRQQMIDELNELGFNYHFEKYTDRQIYYIYQKTLDKVAELRKQTAKKPEPQPKPEPLFKQETGTQLSMFPKSRDESFHSNSGALLEDTRNQLLAKSRSVDTYKDTSRGKNRFERKKFSKTSTSTQQYNNINMDDFFKKDLLVVAIPVIGETNEYTVSVQLDGVVTELARNIKANNNVFEYKCVIQAITKVFNSGNVKIKCTCDDFKYRYAHNLIINGNSVDGTDKDPGAGHTGIVDQMKGQGCKHILLVLNNSDWVMKIANVIRNYILYMSSHKQSLFLKFIFPKLYGMPADAADESGLVPEEISLETSKDIIDEVNKYAKDKGKFKKGENKNPAKGSGKLTGPESKAESEETS